MRQSIILRADLFSEDSPPFVIQKHLLVRQAIFKNTHVRDPVGFKLDDETKHEVERQFDRMIAAAQ